MSAKGERACHLISELYWIMRLEELGITFLEFKALVHLKGTRCSRPLMLKGIERAGKELEEEMFSEMSSEEKSNFLLLLEKAIKGFEGCK